jgi:hypothetical protein
VRRGGRAVALVTVASMAVVGDGCGLQTRGAASGAAARPPAASATSTLASVPFPAYPSVSDDGSSGFDAVWTAGTVVTSAHWSPATATWAPATGLLGTMSAFDRARIAASATGAAAVAWMAGSPGSARAPDAVEASYRPAIGSPWQQTATLFSSRIWAVSSPAVAVDNRGDAFALWSTGDGAIDLAEHPAGATGWSRWGTVLKDPHLGSLGFAASPGGTLVIAWEHHLSGGLSSPARDLLYVKVRPAGGRWRPTLDLGAEGRPMLQDDTTIYQPAPDVAINASGRVFIAWQWPHRNGFYPRVAVLTPRSRWRRPRFTSLPQAGLNPVIAGDDRGSSTVAWDGPEATEAGEISSDGRVLAVRRLGPAGDPPAIAGNGRGDVVVGWTSNYTAVALRPAGHGWCASLHLSLGTEVAVALAPDGVAQVIWHRGSNTHPNVPVLARTLTRCRA